jgi:hypothetical protein
LQSVSAGWNSRMNCGHSLQFPVIPSEVEESRGEIKNDSAGSFDFASPRSG